jgi:serine phosphatase RsbU (regulator of sigma subunit)
LRYVLIFIAAVFIETIRITRRAIRSQQDGAWIIAAGFLLLAFFSSYDALLDLGLLLPINDISNGYPFGFLGLIICMSIYLARDFARTNEKLLMQERQAREQEIQHRLLEADNARKTRELEAARKLQLAMLPKSIPQPPSLDIAVFMKPATEVGGDYYDFHEAADGTLMAAIGDATGHGTKAGIMVATMKSMFTAAGADADLAQFFNSSTRVLKQMNLGNLYMALTLVKFKNNFMQAVGAGMPPILLYRPVAKSVEELALKGMPLGSVAEMFNQNGEILDYPAAKSIFSEVAHKPPHEIIAHLTQAGERWANGRPQEDDVTFVVMKIKA